MQYQHSLAALVIALGMAGAPPSDAEITLGSRPVTRELTLPPLAEARDHFALRVAGISPGPGNPALFRVFVELPSANASTPSTSEHYVGRVSILAGGSRNPKNVLMTLNWPHDRKLSPGAKLRFTLVPVGEPGASPIRIEKLEIIGTHP